MSYRITGLDPAPFLPLYGLTGAQLSARGVHAVTVDQSPGFPDRVEMREGRPGERMLLLNHLCQGANSPYRARHAIYVRDGATERFEAAGEIPEVMRTRILSLRGYDAAGMMVDAGLAQGDGLEDEILRLLDRPEVAYLHAHNAIRGCYSGRIDRIG